MHACMQTGRTWHVVKLKGHVLGAWHHEARKAALIIARTNAVPGIASSTLYLYPVQPCQFILSSCQWDVGIVTSRLFQYHSRKTLEEEVDKQSRESDSCFACLQGQRPVCSSSSYTSILANHLILVFHNIVLRCFRIFSAFPIAGSKIEVLPRHGAVNTLDQVSAFAYKMGTRKAIQA